MSIKDGDIFRWGYKDEQPEHLRAFGRYHCKSRIAVARGGLLIDTFWGTSLSDSTHWPYDEAEKKLNLTLLGNFSDLEKRPEYDAAYYDDADCVDLNHSNASRGHFYIRKGAQRSRTKMRAILVELIDEAERRLELEQGKLERRRGTLESLDAGADLDGVSLV